VLTVFTRSKTAILTVKTASRDGPEPVFLYISIVPYTDNYFASAHWRAKLSYLQPFNGEKDTFWPHLKEGQKRQKRVQI